DQAGHSSPGAALLMHWLRSRVLSLHLLAAALGSRSSDRAEAEEHQRFLAAVRTLVDEVVSRPGVTACVVCHDGLNVHAQGASEDLEAVSAMVQLSAAASGHAAARLRLGSLRQMVIVGLDQKLAL